MVDFSRILLYNYDTETILLKRYCMKEDQEKIDQLYKFLIGILGYFRPVFSRKKAYVNFKRAIKGFLIADEMKAVTDLVRYVEDEDHDGYDKLYERLIKFFHASSYSLEGLQDAWRNLIADLNCFVKVGGYNLLVGDGVKVAKTGRHMVGVKKMHQESESMSKREYIYGQMYGSIGILVGDGGSKAFCLPIETTIQDGNAIVESWMDPSYEHESHVVKMMQSAARCLKAVGSSILALDRYFLTKSAVKSLIDTNGLEENVQQKRSLILVTKTRSNSVAFEPPPKEDDPHKRGRKKLKGAKVKLYDLFEERKTEFVEKKMFFYDQVQDVRYYCIGLLWSAGQYQPMRFVLVETKKQKCILVSSDTSLEPEQIVISYGFRWKIEQTFKDAKQSVGTFSSHFWTPSMPRLDRYRRKGLPDPLAAIDNEDRRKRIISSYEAYGKFTMVGNIAQGLLQLMALKANEIGYESIKYLRTYTKKVMSEDSMNFNLRKTIKQGIDLFNDAPIPHLISQTPIS